MLSNLYREIEIYFISIKTNSPDITTAKSLRKVFFRPIFETT